MRTPQELLAVVGSTLMALCLAALIWVAMPSLYRRAAAMVRDRVIYSGQSLLLSDVPVLGMLPSLLLNLHRFYDWSDEVLAARGGSIRFRGLWPARTALYVTSDPRNVEHVLLNHSTNYLRSEGFASSFREILGHHGLFILDSRFPEWRVQRKLTSLHVASTHYRTHLQAAVLDAVRHKLVPLLEALHQQLLTDQRAAIDLQDILLRYSLHAVCSTAFGFDITCLDPDLPALSFVVAAEKAMNVSVLRWYMPSAWWKTLRWLKLGRERELAVAIESLDAFATEIISHRRQKLAQDEKSCRDILHCFMKAEDTLLQAGDSKEGHGIDKVLRDVVMTFLFAGREGPGLCLSWFFWLLANHPEEEEKVLAEVRRVLRVDHTNGQDLITDQLTAEKVHEMVYVHAALAETLRLYPTVPFNERDVLNDDTLPNGDGVRRGDRVLVSAYSMGRMKSIWGPDASSFRPQRWLQAGAAGVRLISPSPFEYTIFGAGRRSCLGKSTSFFTMKAAVAAIIVNFRIVLLPSHKVSPKLSIGLYMKDGLLATLERRTFAN